MNFFFYCDTPTRTNEHLIHTDTCDFLPEVSERSLIGKAKTYEEALSIAKTEAPDKHFSSCKECC
ncbi:MAG: hypothetical protein ACTJG1_00315 [Enterococcus gilvus]